jgi:hypothetical protein
MSDTSEILRALTNIQNDIWTIREDQKRIHDSIATYTHDFSNLGAQVHEGFQKWSGQASKDVAQCVLDVHGPRIDALNNYIHKFKSCNWCVFLPARIYISDSALVVRSNQCL